MSWAKGSFSSTDLERCHAEHTTFKMCRRKVLTFVASQPGYITFCLSRGCDHTLLKYHAMKMKL
jgi:hypothetical protein